MPQERDSQQIRPDEAITRLSEALEICRSVVADYRATLAGAAVLDESAAANDDDTRAQHEASTSG